MNLGENSRIPSGILIAYQGMARVRSVQQDLHGETRPRNRWAGVMNVFVIGQNGLEYLAA